LVNELRGENSKSAQYSIQYLFSMIRESIDIAGYLNNILIIPYDGNIANFNVRVKSRTLLGDTEILIDPAIIITKAL